MTLAIPVTRRRVLMDALAGAGAAWLLSGASFGTAARAPAPAGDDATTTGTGAVGDFDFFFGAWQVQHRRLKERLAGNHEWEEFDGSCRVLALLGGRCNINERVANRPGGTTRGLGLRAFDPETGTWADWNLDARDPHKIDVPIIGTFANGVGTFVSDDTFDGQPIKVRGVFSRITPTSLQWEQAFSPDGGKTWETNWVMRYTRTA